MDKVLFIGLDGMDPKVTGMLVKEGKLPNFARLEFSELSTSYPPNSPVAWTSIATGSNPGRHGIFDFIRRDSKTYMPELSLSKSLGNKHESLVRADPFWRISSSNGVPTTVIRFPVTFPPESVKGNMLSGLGVPDIKGFLSSYSFYTTDPEPTKNTVSVSFADGVTNGVAGEVGRVAESFLSGPKARKGQDIVDVTIPMKIEIKGKSAKLTIGNKADSKTYEICEGGWSGWIRAAFKVGIMQTIRGICKAHLVSINPFRMYVTTVQIDPEAPLMEISKPSQYSAELAREIGVYHTLGIPEETDPYRDGRISGKAFLQQCAQIEEERERMFWREFDRFKKGVYAFVFDTSDRIQHVFWRNKVSVSEKFNLTKEIEDYWVQKDKFIGKVLGRLKQDTSLIISSDHGFTSFERAVSINTWLADEGYITFKAQFHGDGGLFEYVNWGKTEAYSLGFNSLYINAKGRESKGVVEDREGLAKEISSKLEKLRDSGAKVIERAYLREEIYSGKCVQDAPDIVLGFRPGYRMAWQTAVGGFTNKAVYDNNGPWDGDHLVDPRFVPGVLLSNSSISPKKHSVLDIAPTILENLSLDHSSMEGKPIA